MHSVSAQCLIFSRDLHLGRLIILLTLSKPLQMPGVDVSLNFEIDFPSPHFYRRMQISLLEMEHVNVFYLMQYQNSLRWFELDSSTPTERNMMTFFYQVINYVGSNFRRRKGIHTHSVDDDLEIDFPFEFPDDLTPSSQTIRMQIEYEKNTLTAFRAIIRFHHKQYMFQTWEMSGLYDKELKCLPCYVAFNGKRNNAYLLYAVRDSVMAKEPPV